MDYMNGGQIGPRNHSRRAALSLLLPAGSALVSAGCVPGSSNASASPDHSGHTGAAGATGQTGQSAAPGPGAALVAWPSQNRWPERFQRAQPDVQEAYRYAVANPQVLQYFPCFCGCEDEGHTSNKDCYIDEFRSDGSVLLDSMSFG